jgi:hypothetical protein
VTVTAGWLKVRLASGQEGWVGSAYIASSTVFSTLPVVSGPVVIPPPAGGATGVVATYLNLRTHPVILALSRMTVGEPPQQRWHLGAPQLGYPEHGDCHACLELSLTNSRKAAVSRLRFSLLVWLAASWPSFWRALPSCC